MPTYCYVTDDGEHGEFVFPMGKAPATVEINGKSARRDWRAEMSGMGSHGDYRGWPIASEAAGVHPTQRKLAMKIDRDLGVPTEYTKDARPVFRSRSHQRRWLKVHNGFNRDDY